MTFKLLPIPTIKSIARWALLGAIIVAGLFAYEENFYKFSNPSPQAPVSIIDTIKAAPVKLQRFNQTYSTVITFSLSNNDMVFRDCQTVNVRVFAEDDSVCVSNSKTDSVLVYGKVFRFSDNHSTVVGLALNFGVVPVPMTLSRFVPPTLDHNDPDNLSIVLHVGTSDAPYFLFSRKHTCEELQKYLGLE